MKVVVCVVAAVLLGGCASTHMKQYVGKDIREVILDDGPPLHAMDLGDGVRAFQYPFGGGAYTAPSVTTTSGSITRSGWLSATSITTGGGTVVLPPCIMTYITRWDPDRAGWIVRDYRIPKQTFC